MENKITSYLFNKVGVGNVRRFLNLSSMRQKLISGNIANVSTPGYESKDFDFEGELKNITDKSSHLSGTMTHSGHLPLGRSEARSPEVESQRVATGEINSVDIDQEIPRLAKNELMYTIGARILRNKFDGLRKVITSK